jgi:hypothetical protein
VEVATQCPGLVHLYYVDKRGTLHMSYTLNSTMSQDLSIPDSVDIQRLQAMQVVAKMKEAADRQGIAFVGGFVTPDGEKFVMSNVEGEDYNDLLPQHLQ